MSRQPAGSKKETKMTKAFEIMATAQIINDALAVKAAKSLAISIDQDLENESTIYSFADGSVLVVSAPKFSAYTSRVYPQYKIQADEKTGEWIGDFEFVDYVTRTEWLAKRNTEKSHFDFYEKDGKTRAVEVVLE